MRDDQGVKRDDENIYGRGTIDMKGSVAVALTIMKHLQTKAKVTLLITSDEELTGACASELSKYILVALLLFQMVVQTLN